MIPEKLYHATYKQFLKSIQQKGLGNTKRKMWSDSVRGVVYLADDPWEAESYAEESEWVDEREDPDIYLNNIIILEIDVSKLDINKLEVDKNVLLDEGEENSTWEYHGVIPWEACKIFNKKLNEWKLINNNSSNQSTVDYSEEFKKLLAHLKTIFIKGCSNEKITSTSFYVDLAFGFNRQSIEIKYQEKQDYFTVQIKEKKTKQIMFDLTQNTWDDVLSVLCKNGYIRNTNLDEQLSIIDEIKLYNNLWK